MRLRYMDALYREIERWGEELKDHKVITVFIGGGTPSLLSGSEIMLLMKTVRENFDLERGAEITIESNPGTLSEENLSACLLSGINRLSMGLQSCHNNELKILGRIHRFEDFLKNYTLARSVGFQNINIDLMSALPHQTTQSWEDNLKQVIALSPEHISAYSLIIEEGTPFYDLYHREVALRDADKLPAGSSLPTEDEEREMYHLTGSMLKTAGYGRYEISNYALSGKECAHNKVYWTRGEYLGLGLGASSLLHACRFKNTSVLKDYCVHPENAVAEEELLSKQAAMSEAMFLGLRLTEGVDMDAFRARYEEDPLILYEDWIKKMCSEGLLVLNGTHLYLSETGLDLANYVMGGFV